MKPFMSEDFLLNTDAARHLYHDFAKDMPIIDYHCHLPPEEIAEDAGFRNVGHLMLGGDHYKWRAMAAFGYDNVFIRTSGDRERFFAYAKAMPMMAGNPLYHWTHLELRRVFDITDALNPDTAQRIWDEANEKLKDRSFHARALIRRFNVRALCTTDDPADTLKHHRALDRDAGFPVRVLPAFRPDKGINVNRDGFRDYIGKLSRESGVKISSAQDVIAALEKRIAFFHDCGCRLSDHALDTIPFAGPDDGKADQAFREAMDGRGPDDEAAEHYRTKLLVALGESYCRRGWVQQYHIGALRNANSRLYGKFGPDTGFDANTDAPVGENLAKLLDAQETKGMLPKTILYSLNPAANYTLATLAGCFQGGTPGKIQFGSAWWFCDQHDGMTEQMKALSSIGLISQFVGMLTDSRSFMSYPRHEYFRRIFCDILGGWVERGEYPDDEKALETIVKGVCYRNAKDYFDFGLTD